MKTIIPEIYVKNCKEALEYYKDIFNGEIKNIQKGDGIPMFKGHECKIIHSELHIDKNCILYLVDIFDENEVNGNINLVLELDSMDEINNIYQKLNKNGTIKFELQKTFWGAYHAVVTDRYGNTWGLNYTVSK